jgi:predicted RNA-binding Zn ribbon-like protein
MTRYDLDDLLVVANTRHGPGGHHGARVTRDGPDHDHLRDPRDARAFLVSHDVEVPASLPTPGELRRLRELREVVRMRVEASLGEPSPPVAGRAGYAVDARGRLAARSGGWRAVIDDLRLPLVEIARHPVGQDSLKICGNRLCRWVFADRSRNSSRRWCDMAACGNRAKVARHRLTSKDGSPASRAPASRNG